MQKTLTRFLLLTLVLSLGFGQLLRFEYLGLPLYLHDCLVALILLLNFPALARPVRTLASSLSLFLLGLAIGWLVALVLFPLSSLLIPSLYTLRLIAYLMLYFLCKSSSFLIPHYYFLLSGITCLTIGLSQYFLLPDMRIFQYLGWDDHLFRLTLPHFDPTFTGVMLVLAILSSNSLYSTNIFRLTSIVYIIGILLTYSRSVWLSLALTAAAFIRNKKILLVSGILLLSSIFLLPKKFGEGTNLLRIYSLTSRWQTDLAYAQKAGWTLLLGQGLNTLTPITSPSSYPLHPSGPNNSYLYLLLTTGILGLLGWGKFMFSLYRTSSLKPMWLFFFVASLFNNVMFYPFALLWVLLVSATAPSEA